MFIFYILGAAGWPRAAHHRDPRDQRAGGGPQHRVDPEGEEGQEGGVQILLTPHQPRSNNHIHKYCVDIYLDLDNR